ncbi:MAG: hypothetical protein ACON4C_10835, partial [Henriciella sp.]
LRCGIVVHTAEQCVTSNPMPSSAAIADLLSAREREDSGSTHFQAETPIAPLVLMMGVIIIDRFWALSVI